MMHRMDKQFAINKAGSEAALAKLLGLSRQAVNQWPEAMPPLQVYRLRDIKPKWVAEWRRAQATQEAA